MSFKHITAEDRSAIATLTNEGCTSSYIARRIGVNRSTIGREITRNQIKPKPVQPARSPVRPAILDIGCRRKRGSGLAQDKYEAAEAYAKQVAEVKRHNRFYVSNEANKRAAGRRTAANRRRIRLVYGSHSWLETYVRRHLTHGQWSPDQISGDLEANHNVRYCQASVCKPG